MTAVIGQKEEYKGKVNKQHVSANELRSICMNTEEDDPVEVERLLLAEATYKNGVLPPWNNQLY